VKVPARMPIISGITSSIILFGIYFYY